jgi:predicted esterase
MNRRLHLLCAAAVLLPLLARAAEPQTPPAKSELPALARQLQEEFQKKDYENALKTCEKLIVAQPKEKDHVYNQACALARLDRPEEALAALARAAELGFGDVGHIESDDDLAALRELPAFKALLAKLREQNAPQTAVQGRVKTVTGWPEGGLKYKLLLAAPAPPQRLVVWLHPSGGSGNQAAESLAPLFLARGRALLLFTEKNWMGWTEEDLKRLGPTIGRLKELPGLSVERPLLLGFSAGGQAALNLWQGQPASFGGLILDAAYPLSLEAYARGKAEPLAIPADPGVKAVPFFVLVGGKDGGRQVWEQALPKFKEAGIAVEYHVIPGRGHEWLFGPAEQKLLGEWLDKLAPPGAPPGADAKK